jgi:hypothetical protein
MTGQQASVGCLVRLDGGSPCVLCIVDSITVYTDFCSQ